jgi:hypothetical protein
VAGAAGGAAPNLLHVSLSNVHAEAHRSPDARCAYCHDALRGAVATCARCHTVCHDDCREQLGRCPTLGCDGVAPTPPSPRTRAHPSRARFWIELIVFESVAFLALAPVTSALALLTGYSAYDQVREGRPGAWVVALLALMLGSIALGLWAVALSGGRKIQRVRQLLRENPPPGITGRLTVESAEKEWLHARLTPDGRGRLLTLVLPVRSIDSWHGRSSVRVRLWAVDPSTYLVELEDGQIFLADDHTPRSS